MKKTVVYKITRTDDLSYIGITIDFKSRLKYHSKSLRFTKGIKSSEILHECDTYEEAENLEEYYIKLHDTYKNGLNVTYNGKGKTPFTKFNTLGFVFSEETKKKMRLVKLKNPVRSMLGKSHSEETKRKWSIKRKNKFYGKRKITAEDLDDIISVYKSNALLFNSDYIKEFCCISQQRQWNSGIIPEIKILKSGQILTRKILYVNFLTKQYNVSSTRIRQILKPYA